MNKQKISNRAYRHSYLVLGMVFAFGFILAQSVSAHVAVKPSEVGVAAFQSFSLGVPTEKDSATVGLRLVLPEGLNYVTPNVKPGWTITVKKQGEGMDAKVTEISWTNGEIPMGQRDEFIFSAQVPAKETTLQWKAYQTYADGTVVAWDQKPAAEEKDDDGATSGPYSETTVINDLKPTPMAKSDDTAVKAENLSIVAIALAAVALALQLRKKQ